ncbi:tumor necrosis factor receptor superfamily member 5 isoform X1 [Sagmatias obliquidens]|uniref:tumor necrosis factor receptor superfamily member 5 isoform X1 n=1 Tax=Sagmatias obliquidens TaxID=3371155 RepID=UPI000F443F75|nr:tumor necrosis factor receptor superfamily member 5 isoform X1 [Lagenorhynchus obliquidens]
MDGEAGTLRPREGISFERERNCKVHAEPPTSCRENQYQTNSRCCNLCPPGQKLMNDCTEVTETDCRPCSKGEFLATRNSEKYCHQHRYCNPNLGLQIQTEGTSITDTICTCDEGHHCTSHTCESCTPHSLCLPGFGVKQMATGVSDTICERCPVGFFSSVSSAFEKCHPWTSCESKGLVEQHAGTNKTDVVCGFQNRMRALVVIPITMVILFTVLLVSACIRKMAKKQETKALHPKAERQDPVETIDPEDFLGPHSTPPVQETLHWCQPVAQEDGKESRISVQERE